MSVFDPEQLDDFFIDIHDVLFGDDSASDEEDIVCTSCSRGRLLESVMMPRLPNYRTVHQKKENYKTDIGLAEKDISRQKRVLGRGRAKAKAPKILAPVGRPDQNPDSSCDERLTHTRLYGDKEKIKRELRKPRNIPKILNQDFPKLPNTNEPDIKPPQTGNANLQDMAKFLMDSWQDEVDHDEGQFDDVSFSQEIDVDSQPFESETSSKDRNKEFRIESPAFRKQDTCQKSNEEQNSNDSLKQKTDEYFNKLTEEIDNIDLQDFENMEVSDLSNQLPSSTSNETIPANSKAINGIWYSSDEVYKSSSANGYISDTSCSYSTDSILPLDNCPLDSESDNLPNVMFDMTLPDTNAKSQGNVTNNAKITSNSEQTSSSLSISCSESGRNSFTSEKDESVSLSEPKNVSRKEKKKKRDAERAKSFHDKYPNNRKESTDSNTSDIAENKENLKKCKVEPHACSWGLDSGDSVIQLDGLPKDCDISDLHDLIASYGTIIDYEKQTKTFSSSVRFKLNSVDACEMVVSCLDDTDIFPDAESRISCVLVN